jgi:hypothetical protein
MTAEKLQELLPTDFPMNSKAWIYQSSRPFSEKEELEINEQLHQFYSQWASHGTPVRGWAKLLFGQFVVVLADEEATGVSGCSTDSMVRVIKSLERQYTVQLFDRLTLTFLVNGKAQMLPMGQVSYALEKGYISPETPFFNNSITSYGEVMEGWIVPLNKSWMATRLGLQ